MTDMTPAPSWPRYAGVLVMLLLHAAAFWALLSHRLVPTPQAAATLFVDFISPDLPRQRAPVAAPQAPRYQPRRDETPAPQPLAAQAPLAVAAVAAVPPALTFAAAPAAEPTPAAAAGPVQLTGELAVSCPQRSAPSYPLASRRMNETGTALLKVELDPEGRVSLAEIAASSGSARLDQAALAAVRTWRCNPAQKNGQPVRAVALQPIKFVLQGG